KGGVLVIYCLNSTKFLYGKSAADWDLQDGSDTSGAYAGSVCEAPNGDVLAIDERGLMPLQATQSFGDFESASISQRIDQFLKRRRRMLVGCVPVKDKAQYRAFYSDGLGFTLTYRGDRLAGYSFFRLPVVPTCLFAGEDANGNAMLLMGAANGFVYRLDVGYSYDGIAIEHILRLASDSCGSPRVLKQFLSGSLQIVAPRPVSVLVKPEFDYSLTEADIAQTVGAQRSVLSDAWDVANWDELAWDVGDERGSITYPEFNIDGNGLAISLVIYHGGEIKPPITIESGIYNFNNRGQRPRGGFGL
ncbi:MAG TPA: hypothetical protein VFS42_06895, partial [Burkholderiaceae bacterium]|nr:hypothetical protein [Burkholderiaceae bacterium]